jgi:hypothetical protein
MVGDGDLPPLGQLWSSEHSQAISTQLASLSLEIAQIDRLKDFPGGSLPLVVTENPWVTMLPELADLRFSAKLKCLDILNKAIKGDTASLVEDVTVLSRLGQLLTDHPVLITSLVKIACDSLSIQVIEEVNALTTLSPEQLTSISDQLAIVEAEDPIRWGLLGERALQIKAFQWALKRNRTDRREIPIFPGVIGFQGWHMCDMAAGIRIENKLMLSVNEPRKRLDKAKQLENEFEALPKYYLFTNILCFILVRALELSLRTTAQIRAARVGLAIEHYRIDKGNFPERLEQLMPDYMQVLPQDPFDDQPLHYKLTTDAAIVYSIGEDGVDNGGDVRRENCGSQPADVGFTVLKPERRRLSAQKSDTATQTAPASSASGR